MSLRLAKIRAADPRKNLSREKILELLPEIQYLDGRTKQSFKDETDINKIMARFEKTGTISHLAKYEGVYGDFSDYDFHENIRQLTKGREIFDALSGEVRREFNQSPQAFFDYVNDPANRDDLHNKLPGLAAPGTQLPPNAPPTADNLAALAAEREPATATPSKTDPDPTIKSEE